MMCNARIVILSYVLCLYRTTFSPIFSSGKLRKMTPLLQAITKKMYNHVLKLAKSEEAFETKELTGKFTLDGLATSIFGVEAGSFNEEEGEFLTHAKNVFQFDKSSWLRVFLCTLSPTFVKKAAVSIGLGKLFTWPLANDHSKFLMHIVDESFKQRKGSQTKRNDLLDLMIEAVDGNLEATEDHNLHAYDQFEKNAKIVHDVKKKSVV